MSFDSYKIKEQHPHITGAEDNGDFAYFKQFVVANITHPGVNLSGIIIQAVMKNSKVTDANGYVYSTTDSINHLTSNNVNYSCDSYLEVFEIDANGNSLSGDQFANGAMVQYDANGPIIYKTNDKEYQIYKTYGGIVMYGRSFFIPATNPHYQDILKLGWNNSPHTPANGLLFMPYNENLYNQLASFSQSNFLDHHVQVIWSFDNPKSQVQSSIVCVPNPNTNFVNSCSYQGGKKRKRKTKKNNKRRRGKTYRRH